MIWGVTKLVVLAVFLGIAIWLAWSEWDD